MKSTDIPLPYEMVPEMIPETIMEISPSDIDQPGHVNNVIYLRWVQTGATKHWYAIATGSKNAVRFNPDLYAKFSPQVAR